MERRKNWVQKMTDGAELHGEVLPGVSLVELAGDRRVLIECHGGVTEYSREKICVKVRFGSICITGDCLEMTVMTKERLVISGIIGCIQVIRRRK